MVFSQNIAQRALRRRQRKRNSQIRGKRAAPSTTRDTHIDFMSLIWGKLLVKLSAQPGGPSIESRDGRLFRRRFRVPWLVFVDLLQKCKAKHLFGLMPLQRIDCCGNSICPYAIKLLGVLLGRNWLCDDVAEAAGMVETTVRRAFLRLLWKLRR